jgi:hypothetical protein
MVMVMVGKALVMVVVTGDDGVLFWGSHYGNAVTRRRKR